MSAAYALWVVGLVTGDAPIHQWLETYDVDAHNGQGRALFTRHLKEARKFATLTDAMEAWKTQSTVVPLRPDGKPNRPLTAYTVMPVRLDAEGLAAWEKFK